ncbi:hypothetical protein MT371_12985 [Vibrio parahaemolyticus]|nr:hypothetical protein [Vibrio parahaemolyticus]
MTRKEIIVGVIVPITVAFIGLISLVDFDSSDKKESGKLVIERSFLYTNPDIDAPGNWIEGPLEKVDLDWFPKMPAIAFDENGFGVTESGDWVGSTSYHFGEEKVHRLNRTGEKHITWDFNDRWLNRYAPFERNASDISEGLKREIFTSGFLGQFPQETIREYYSFGDGEVFWWNLIAAYYNSHIDGVPSKRLVLRNTGGSNLTILRVIAKRVYSSGDGAGGAGEALTPSNTERTLELTYLRDTQLILNNPVSIPPNGSAVLQVDLYLTRGASTDAGGMLGFALSIEYFDGYKTVELLEGFYSLRDNQGFTGG